MVLQLQLPLRGSSFQFATWESRELQVEDIQTSLTGKFVDFVEFLNTMESVLNLYPILAQEARARSTMGHNLSMSDIAMQRIEVDV